MMISANVFVNRIPYTFVRAIIGVVLIFSALDIVKWPNGAIIKQKKTPHIFALSILPKIATYIHVFLNEFAE